MNYIDILILVPVIYAGWKGFKHGLIIEVFTLLALVVGLYAGIHFSDYVAGVLKTSFDWHSKYVPVVSFTITFLGVGAMVYFAGKAIEGTGMGGGKRVGRPKKIKVEVSVMMPVVKKGRGRPRKVC